MKRRDFFKGIAATSGFAILAATSSSTIFSSIALAEGGLRKKAGADAGPEMVDPKDPTANSLGYVADAKKSPKSAGNKCSTCSLYQKTGMKDNKEIGSCAIFPKKFVNADAFCNSWAKKV